MHMEYANADKTPLLTIGAKTRKHLEVLTFKKDKGALVRLVDGNGVLRAAAWAGKVNQADASYWSIASIDTYQKGVERNEIFNLLDTAKFTKAYDAAIG